MARKKDDEFDDYVEQDLKRGDRSRSEREPTRTCRNCNGGQVTEMEETRDSRGKATYRNVTKNCTVCGGGGVR